MHIVAVVAVVAIVATTAAAIVVAVVVVVVVVVTVVVVGRARTVLALPGRWEAGSCRPRNRRGIDDLHSVRNSPCYRHGVSPEWSVGNIPFSKKNS